jgi:hypothetical protein
MPAQQTAPLERLDGGRIKGGILHAHLDWARQRIGQEYLAQLLARVSPATAEILSSSILATEWYPFRSVIELDRAVAAAVGGEELEVAAELGRHSARLNLTQQYKVFSGGDPAAFFRREALLHRQFLDFGRAQVESTGPNSCRISLSEYTCFAKVFCASARGYYEQAAQLQGGKLVVVREHTCICDGALACVFEVSWS